MKKDADEDPARAPGCGWIELAFLVGAVVLVVSLALPGWLRARRERRAVAGVECLKTVTVAEAIFREGDKEQDGNLDYGMLSELGNTDLVDSFLGHGAKDGYRFQATYSFLTSEFLWFATSEAEEHDDDDRYFVTNQAGVIFYTTGGPVALDTLSCSLPVPGLLVVPRRH